MNVFAGKKWRCRCREWTCGHSGGGESGMNGESSVTMYTLSGVRWVGGEKQLERREPSLALCDDLERWAGRGGRPEGERINV